MQIYCQRFLCHKAVEVCYWTCKFRGKCLDWQKALKESPGAEAIGVRLESAAKKSGRTYEPTDLVIITSANKKAEQLSAIGSQLSVKSKHKTKVKKREVHS